MIANKLWQLKTSKTVISQTKTSTLKTETDCVHLWWVFFYIVNAVQVVKVLWHSSEFHLQLCSTYLLKQDVAATKDLPHSSSPLPEQDMSGHPANSALFLCYHHLLLASISCPARTQYSPVVFLTPLSAFYHKPKSNQVQKSKKSIRYRSPSRLNVYACS